MNIPPKEYELIDYILEVPKTILPLLVIFFAFNTYSLYDYFLYLKNRSIISQVEVAPVNEIKLLPLQLIEDTLYVDSDIFETTMYKTGGTTGTEIILQKVPVDTQSSGPTHKYTSETLLTYFFDELISEDNINDFIRTNNLENIIRYESFDIRYAFSPKQKMREKRFYVILFRLHTPASANLPELSREYVDFIHLRANNKILEEIAAQVSLLEEFFLFREKRANDKIIFEQNKARKKLISDRNDLIELQTIYQNIIDYIFIQEVKLLESLKVRNLEQQQMLKERIKYLLNDGVNTLESSVKMLKEQSTIAQYLNIEQPIMVNNQYSNMIKDSSQSVENYNKDTKKLLSIIEYGYLAIDKQVEIIEERISNNEIYPNPILNELYLELENMQNTKDIIEERISKKDISESDNLETYSIKLEEVTKKVEIINKRIDDNIFYPVGLLDEYIQQHEMLKASNTNSINMISKIISKFNLSEYDFKIVNSDYSKPTTLLERHNFTLLFVTITGSIFVMILFLLFKVELMKRKKS